MSFTNQDLDELISRLQGYDASLLNNMLDILIKMVIVGYGSEAVNFLLEVVDEGYFIEIEKGNYDNEEILNQFDTALVLDEKIQVLSIIGNDIFEDFAVGNFFNAKYNNRSLVMITSFVRLMIDNRYYIKIYNPDDELHDSEIYGQE